jgi:CheY-like chemotaxis protein
MLDRQSRSWTIQAGLRALGQAWSLLATSLTGRRAATTDSPDAAHAAPRSQPADGRVMIDAAPLPAELPRSGPLRVLVVEDDKVNQIVVLGMLRQMAHSADCVADGVEALEALNRESYDIVLMDVRMPNMDGIEATQRIRRLAAPLALIPIIALTANATTEERLRCADAGMSDFISKPFRRAELETAMEKWRPRRGDRSTGDRPSPDPQSVRR